MKENKLTTEQFQTVIKDFVRLSAEGKCPECGEETKLVGEVRENGNWVCPYCLTYFPQGDVQAEVPFIKLTNELSLKSSAQPKGESILLGVNPSFPMNVSTGFLVPSYSYRIKRKRNAKLAVMSDFTRKGRIKSGNIWQFDLSWNQRPIEEYTTLIAFAEERGYHLPFDYTDPVLNDVTRICYFDSDVSDAEPSSFDSFNFSVRITE
jgi:hypothetical protein